ncbi:MAG: sialate O-acetylesterase [Pseudomonadota bacterium]
MGARKDRRRLSDFLSGVGLSRRAGKPQANFLLAGQSNIDEWFHVDDGAVLETFRKSFLRLKPQYRDVELFRVSRGGSALFRQFAEANAREFADDPDLFERVRRNYWFDERAEEPGPAFDRAKDRIGRWMTGKSGFEGVIWSQGESDAIHVGQRDCDRYTEGLAKVLKGLSQCGGDCPVFVQELGRITPSHTAQHARVERVRAAQRAVAHAHDEIVIATTTFDLPLRDEVHLTTDSYHMAAKRMAAAVAGGEYSPTVLRAHIDEQGAIAIQLDLADSQTLDRCPKTAGLQITSDGSTVPVEALHTDAEGSILVVPARPIESATIDYAGPATVDHMGSDDFLTVTGPHMSLPVRPFRTTAVRR